MVVVPVQAANQRRLLSAFHLSIHHAGIRRCRASPAPARSRPRTGAWCGSGAASAPGRSAPPRESGPETEPSAATWPRRASGTRRSAPAVPDGATAARHPAPGRGTRRAASNRKRRAAPDTRRGASCHTTSCPRSRSPGSRNTAFSRPITRVVSSVSMAVAPSPDAAPQADCSRRDRPPTAARRATTRPACAHRSHRSCCPTSTARSCAGCTTSFSTRRTSKP